MGRNIYDPINSVWAFDENRQKYLERPEVSDDYEYHSSWEWLMPVIEKIGTHHYPDYWSGNKPEDAGEWDDCPYPRTFGMRDKEGNYMFRFNAQPVFSAPTLIEAAYNAVVDFISSHTQNKTT